ncbi:DUF4306 domain-containing protein [Alkalihalobacillus sp. CinArs1]|uniref:DUF4306 domain-containing protein n=1 Tax=Alkalihalobacillus sp. CinArs1 TaxID=2995314 RepID=UPI0022DD38DB|nr:DUF4306 domain-containing protein [Alkalihalobacillus sp. CinArs1]
MRKTFHILLLFPLVVIFGYTFWLSSWTASYLPFSDQWREEVVFTPDAVTDHSEIYLIDYYLYALRYSPFLTIVCTVSFLAILVVLFLLVKGLLGKTKEQA